MKIKDFTIDVLKFIMLYVACIVGAITIYIHFKFNMISFESLFTIVKDVIAIEWAFQQIKISLILLFLFSFLLSYFLKTKYVIILSILLLLLPIIEFDLISYFRYKNTTTNFYEENYVYPVIEKEKKNNLIVIYLESFEDHLATEEISPFLAKLKKENISFNGFTQVSSTFSTINAQYASLCGIKIKQNGSEYMNFAPNINCIPDLLKSVGYTTLYLKAADIVFSRANYFAEQHGFDHIKGWHQLEKRASKITKNYLGNKFGGLKDRVLFEIAKEEMSNLKEPFFAVITSLDMHFEPEIFYDPECEKKFGNYQDVAACTDKIVENLVNWLKKQPFWDKTTLVIMGDHQIPSRYETKSQPLNIFVNSKAKTDVLNRKFTTYDFAPTIMEAMGYNIEKLGVGRSLFSSKETLFEKEGDKFTLLVNAKNKLYEEMKKFENTKANYNPYILNSVLDNNTLMNKYTDFGNKNDWCNKIVYTSMTLDHLPENGVYIKMKYLKMGEPFSIIANGTIVYENKADKTRGFKEEIQTIYLPKSIFKDDRKLSINVSWPYNNMNQVFGLCVKEFSITEKE